VFVAVLGVVVGVNGETLHTHQTRKTGLGALRAPESG